MRVEDQEATCVLEKKTATAKPPNMELVGVIFGIGEISGESFVFLDRLRHGLGSKNLMNMDRCSEDDNERLPVFGRVILAFLIVVSLSSCGGFSRAWEQAPISADDGVSGRWEGTWWSEMNGHKGALRCVASPVASKSSTSDSQDYHLLFHATWARILRGSYQITCRSERTESGWRLFGERDLGKVFGTYSFAGEAVGDSLKATYKGDLDHGKFELLRPASAGIGDTDNFIEN